MYKVKSQKNKTKMKEKYLQERKDDVQEKIIPT